MAAFLISSSSSGEGTIQATSGLAVDLLELWPRIHLPSNRLLNRYNFAHLQWIGYRKYSTHDLQLPRDDAQFQHSLIKKGIPKPPKRSTMAYYHELDEWWVVYHVLSINTIRCNLFRGCQIILHCLLNVSEDSFGPIQSQEFNHSWINNDLSRSPLICTEPFDINLDRPHLMEVVVVVMVWAVVHRWNRLSIVTLIKPSLVQPWTFIIPPHRYLSTAIERTLKG